jgi:hypothetical protein
MGFHTEDLKSGAWFVDLGSLQCTSSVSTLCKGNPEDSTSDKIP